MYTRNLPFIPMQRPYPNLDRYFDFHDISLSHALTNFCHFRNKPEGRNNTCKFHFKIGSKERFLFYQFEDLHDLIQLEGNDHFLPYIQDLINTILLYRPEQIEIGESHDLLFVFYPSFRSYALWMSLLLIKIRRHTSTRRHLYFFKKSVDIITVYITYEARSPYSQFN